MKKQSLIIIGLFIAVFFGVLLANTSAQTQFAELTKLSYATGNSTDYFGRVLAIDGNTIIIGADEFDFSPSVPNTRNGAAFIYVRQPNGAWTLQQSLFPGAGSNDFKFGSCVGISGDTAIVGSPGEEAAYIFVRSGSTWTQQQRITKGGTPSGFSQKCAISGETVIISSRNEPSGVPNSLGAAYIFVRSGVVWTQQARLTAIAGSVNATIGDFVTIDGDTAAIGVQSENSVQVYVRSGATWTPQQRILSSDGSLFGASVAISGDTLIGGAPFTNVPNAQGEGAAYVFTRSAGVWTEQQKLISGDARPQAGFGTSVAIEGSTAVVSSNSNNPINGFFGGAGYVFQRSGTVWTRTQRLFPGDNHGDRFGTTTDLSGSNIVIGAISDQLGANSEQGSAYVFSANPAACTYSLNPARSNLFPASGGAGNFTVTTQAGCAWQATVQDNVAWVQTASAGTGTGTVSFNVGANAGKPRRATITINGQQVYYVNQAAGQAAQAGDLDQTFFNAGFSTNKVFDTNSARGVKVQPDGKAVVVGGSFGGGTGAQVLRYNTDGTLDTTFDGDGIAVVSIGIANQYFYDVALQPDGKIVAAGSAIISGATIDMIVARFNQNGTLDGTFGTNGIVSTNFGADATATSVALLPDGKIVAAGLTFNSEFIIARYNANGSLDTTFDGDGKVIVSGAFSLTDMVLQTDGKIVGVDNGSRTVWRFNTNGSLDMTFDGDGKVQIPISILKSLRTVAIQPDGKILAGGSANGFQNSNDFGIVRLNSNGSFDPTFDGDGLATANIRLTDFVTDIVLQPNGKIVAVGTAQEVSVAGVYDLDTAVARFNPNGSLDAAFGGGGIVSTTNMPTFQDANDTPAAVAIAPDGKIVVAGDYRFRVGQQDVMLLRFLDEGVGGRRSPFDFDGDGKTDIGIFRPAPGEWWYLKSSNGGNTAFTFGTSTDKLVPADFTGDGKTDVAFWRPSTGQWFILRSEDFSFYAFPFGASGDTPVPADYDGDGRADAAVFRESSLTWFIQKSSGGTDIIGFGAAGDKPVPADYDGDGKADIAIYRPSGANGAEWWIRRSSNGSVFAATFGTSTDKPVQGDFTGDGKADIAFFRPSNGNWFILRSEDFSFYAFPFGTSGDVPVAGDYDGDGKYDAGVFRPSSNTWFIQRTTAGTLIQTFGINGDLPLPNTFVP